jgi:hypothetical protein
MSTVRPPARLGLGLGWIAVNAAGYAVALAVWVNVSPPLSLALSSFLGGSVTLALYGFALGLGSGLAQLPIVVRHGVGASRWLAATTAAFALGFVPAAWAALLVSEAFPPGSNKYVSNTTVNIAFGLLLGGSVGLARWLTVRRHGAAPVSWIPSSAVGSIMGFGTAVGVFQLTEAMPTLSLGALFGACVGLVTAFVEWLWLRRTQVWAADPTALREVSTAG